MKVFDVETKGIGGDVVGVGVYDGMNFYFFDSIFDFVEWSKKNKDVYYAHNGGGYDFLYIIRYYMKEIKDILLISGRVVSFKLFECEYRDSYAILPGKLKKLAESFECTNKKIEYDDYEEHKNKEKMIEYLKNDCVVLYEVILKFAISLKVLPVEKLKHTIASIALEEYEKMTKRIRIKPSEYEDVIRKAYYGGRVEVYQRRCGHAYYYDVNSLYPYVMMVGEYPIGTSHYCSNNITARAYYYDRKEGVYLVKIKVNKRKICPLPYRMVNGLVFGYGEFTGWYTFPELDFHEQNGDIEIKEIKECIVWNNSSHELFKDYVNKYYTMKKNSKGAKKYVAKLLLNSLYGKFAQRREREVIVTDINNVKSNLIRQISDGVYSAVVPSKSLKINPIWSVYITSYARIYMYEILKEYEDYVIYTDTDSIITTKEIDKELVDNEDIGKLKLESEINEGYFVSPKCYGLDTKEGIIIKGKGFSREMLSYEKIKEVVETGKEYISEKENIVKFKSGMKNGKISTKYIMTRTLYSSMRNRIIKENLTFPININNIKSIY